MAEVFGEWRREASPCSGGIVLWLRDLAPGPGWGVLDHDGAPEGGAWPPPPGARPRWRSGPTDEGLYGVAVHAANDRPEPLSLRLRVALYARRRSARGRGRRAVRVPAAAPSSGTSRRCSAGSRTSPGPTASVRRARTRSSRGCTDPTGRCWEVLPLPRRATDRALLARGARAAGAPSRRRGRALGLPGPLRRARAVRRRPRGRRRLLPGTGKDEKVDPGHGRARRAASRRQPRPRRRPAGRLCARYLFRRREDVFACSTSPRRAAPGAAWCWCRRSAGTTSPPTGRARLGRALAAAGARRPARSSRDRGHAAARRRPCPAGCLGAAVVTGRAGCVTSRSRAWPASGSGGRARRPAARAGAPIDALVLWWRPRAGARWCAS